MNKLQLWSSDASELMREVKESCFRRLHRRMQCLKVSPDHHRLMAVSSSCSKRCVSVLLQLRSDNSRTNYRVASSPRQVQNSRMLHHPVHPTTSVVRGCLLDWTLQSNGRQVQAWATTSQRFASLKTLKLRGFVPNLQRAGAH